MKSSANIKAHPIHPMLVPFPITFLTTTTVGDVVGYVIGNEFLLELALYSSLAGFISSLIAAVPGIVDYVSTVPPESSAKKRATKHALINSIALVCFIVGALLKTKETNLIIILVLEIMGFVLLAIAGWLGGTLVYRNQIGVDIRYANAGKWKEIKLKSKKEELAKSDELKINQMKLIILDGKRIVLSKTEKGHVAFDDFCSHRGGSLASGSIICGTVQCPWHGSQFDVFTGVVKAGPANDKIKVYQLKEKEGGLYLKDYGS